MLIVNSDLFCVVKFLSSNLSVPTGGASFQSGGSFKLLRLLEYLSVKSFIKLLK